MTALVRHILLALAMSLPLAPALAQGFKPSVLKAEPIRGGAFWLSGGVSNSGFVVGDKGVIVIDTQVNPPDARTALAEIARITAKPVSAVVVSHGDPDHIGGLSAYPADATVIEHEQTVTYVRAAAADAQKGGPVFGPLYQQLAKLTPTRTIGGTETVVIDGVRMVLLHLGPAHTAGDLVVYLPKQKTVYAGDVLLTSQRFPVIHFGGSTLGWITTMKAMLALDADIYVPGHGAIESKAQIRARLRDIEQARERIKAMVAQGKPLAEIEAAFPEPVTPFPSFAATIQQELTTGYPAAIPPWANLIRPMTDRRDAH